MTKGTKKIAGYLILVLVLFLLVFLFISPSNFMIVLLSVGIAVLVAFVWDNEVGIVIMLLLSSIVLLSPFKNPEIILFGFLAVVITISVILRLKTAIKDLKKNERKYQLIANNISGAVYSQIPETSRKLLFLTERFEEVTGYPPSIFLSGEKKIHDIVHPDDWTRVRKVINERIKSKGLWDLEYKIVGSDKKIRWINERGGMVLNEDGIFLIEGIMIDITRRKMIEEALRDSEQKYRNLVERANDGIVIIQEGKIKYANPTIIEMIGCDKEKIAETDFKNYIAEEERDKFISRYNRNARGETPAVYETVIKHINGRKIDVEMNSGFINYEGGLADLLIVREITQRKQIEEIIHQKEEEFRNLVERAPDIITRFDVDHRYVYANPAIEKEMGIHPRDLFWKTPREAGATNDTARIWGEALETVFATREEKAIYTDHDSLVGKKYYYTRLLPEFNKNGEVKTVLAISRDITSAKEIDKVKSDFILISSHQLRTPLSVIRWCVVMFLDGMLGEISKEQREYLEKIYESTKKLIRISNALFNAAILDLGILSVIPRKLNLIEVAKESIKEIESERIEREIKISENYDKDLPEIKADRRLLNTIFKGLLSNAIKYGYKGGNVWFDVGRREKDILVRVSDDGRGIPAKEHSKIFTKFFRAENVKDEELYGTGLDLYIIKEIIESFGGSIWFESPNPEIGKELHRGTIFYFTIPLSGMKKREGEKGLTDQLI